MILEYQSFQRNMRGRAAAQIRRGLRRRPMFTLALIVSALIVCSIVLVLFLAALTVAAVVAALGVVAFHAARHLLRPSYDSTSRPASLQAPSITAELILRRYLDAVKEFSRLTETAMLCPFDPPARSRQHRAAVRDAQRLHELARWLVPAWGGSSSVRLCLDELEAASESLVAYLRELQKSEPARASSVAIRWHRDDLGRRRDVLVQHLRAVNFAEELYNAAGRPAEASPTPVGS